jgi:septal ring factor EnvC (AmiA/AmiB activator)
MRRSSSRFLWFVLAPMAALVVWAWYYAGVLARREAGLAREVAALRSELAALPGPVLRPLQPQAAEVRSDLALPVEPQIAPPPGYILPLAGRLVTGFGESKPGQPRSRGISIAARGGAQVVTPAAGRVAFAGPFQGYGNIVIIEHPGGWTSLVTGLAALDTVVGRQLVSGSPLGVTGPGRAVLTLELRRQGEPVNPLDFVRG